MHAELCVISREAQTLEEAIDRINGVLARFIELAEYLDDQRAEETAGTTSGATDESGPPTPSPSPASTPTEMATPTPSAIESTATVPPSP